jgi:glycoprotein endo-alpha-1,2-mannosidase
MRRSGWLFLAVLAMAGSFGSRVSAQVDLGALADRAKIEYAEVPRKVLAFYYPWYGNADVPGGSGRWSHWEGVDQDRHQIASATHYPKLGPYDSHDPKLIAQHCAWAKEAGLDGFIVSWWGKGDFSDRAMPRILDACREAGLEATIYYETVPRPRNAEAAAADIVGLLKRYGDHPAWLRVGGKPVVFIYGRAVGEIGLSGWLEAAAQVNREYPPKAVLLGDQMSLAAARIFDGIHTYNTAGQLRGKDVAEVRRWAAQTYPGWVRAADAFHRISTLTVIPGYDDTKIRKPGLRVERFDGASYRCQWEEAIRADPHWVLVTSWNEWHEGSEIEPSVEYGDQYLKITAEMAARFKSKPREAKPLPESASPGITADEKRGEIEKLRGVGIGILPDPGLSAVLPLLQLPDRPALVSWEEVAEWPASIARKYPVLIYAGDETYRQTVSRRGDVDAGLLRYLTGGGLLVVLPSGPMPFHYNEQHQAVGTSRKLGLPLSVGGPGGGWEEPPADVDLRFVQVGHRLPHVPPVFPFPEQGDRRWRPFLRSQLAEGDRFIPLVELRDAQGKHYGDAVAYVEHKASEPIGAKALYVWFGLLDSPQGEALLHDVYGFVGETVQAK